MSGNNPNAWLGLLKWSLAYTDGTSDTSPSPMDPEKKAFLEKVMKEGIIDEGERMTTILKEASGILEDWTVAQKAVTPEQEEHVQVLLEELRGIVEQIDYARMFAAVSGLPFLLGMIEEQESIPRSVRMLALGILSTMAANNPPVQQQLLEVGSIRILTQVFFDAAEDYPLQARIVQAISANIRSHEVAESVFCQLEQSVTFVEQAVGFQNGNGNISTVLLQRFFLRALLTSDTSTPERVRQFQTALCWTTDLLLLPSDNDNNNSNNAELDPNVCEMILELLIEVLRQKLSVNAILSRKESLVGRGVERVTKIRKLSGEDREYASIELDLWENLIALLARAEPDRDRGPSTLHNDPEDTNLAAQ